MIAAALTIAAEQWKDDLEHIATEASLLAIEFKHDIFLQVSERYPAPVDDVQVLGNEKGGVQYWS